MTNKDQELREQIETILAGTIYITTDGNWTTAEGASVEKQTDKLIALITEREKKAELRGRIKELESLPTGQGVTLHPVHQLPIEEVIKNRLKALKSKGKE